MCGRERNLLPWGTRDPSGSHYLPIWCHLWSSINMYIRSMFVSVCGCGCVFAQSQHHCWAFMLIETLARLCLLQRDPCSQPRIMSISVIFIYKKKHYSLNTLSSHKQTDPHYKLRYSFMMKMILTCLVDKLY